MPINVPPPAQPYNVALPQAPDLLSMYGKMGQLRQMNGQMQLLPLEIQQEQEKAKQAALTTQQQQLQMASQQAMMKAIQSGDLNKFATANSPDGSGFDAAGAYQHLIQNGVLPEHAGQVVSQFQNIGKNGAEIYKNLTEADKSKYQLHLDTHKEAVDALADVKTQGDLDAAKQSIARIPGLEPEVAQAASQLNLQDIPGFLGKMNLANEIAVHTQKQAEAAKAQLEVAPPSKDQLDTFTTQTIPSFASLKPEQKSAFTSEAKTARTVPELNAIEARADATDKAMQTHADSLAQTKAILGTRFNEKGADAIEKFWTDPQRGYAGALAQAKQTTNSIKAGADGNGLLTSMIPTMEVLGVNHAAGISRISPTEAQAANLPGGWAERWNAWADKAMKGKLSPQLAAEGQQLMGIVTDAAYNRALTSSAYSAHAHNMAPQDTTVMDRDGNWTTLDKVSAKQSPAKSYPNVEPPSGWQWTTHGDGRIGITDGKSFRPYNGK